MRGSLGEKIGEGAYADVHAWAPGRVVKLFKPGFPQRYAWWEARMARAAFAAGAPAPEMFDEVTLEGRFGIVLRRFDGPTLLHLSRSGAMTGSLTQWYVKRQGLTRKGAETGRFLRFLSPQSELTISGGFSGVECQPNPGASHRRSRIRQAG